MWSQSGHARLAARAAADPRTGCAHRKRHPMIMDDAARINAARDEAIAVIERAAAGSALTPFDRGQLRALRQHATPEQRSRVDQLLHPQGDTSEVATGESPYDRGACRARDGVGHRRTVRADARLPPTVLPLRRQTASDGGKARDARILVSARRC
jgi:hypothetical protein